MSWYFTGVEQTRVIVCNCCRERYDSKTPDLREALRVLANLEWVNGYYAGMTIDICNECVRRSVEYLKGSVTVEDEGLAEDATTT